MAIYYGHLLIQSAFFRPAFPSIDGISPRTESAGIWMLSGMLAHEKRNRTRTVQRPTILTSEFDAELVLAAIDLFDFHAH